ncbi:MAG: RimK family alpha-L-glutamate ligase [Planctomycetes bacterium]|jgi:ribosomal protein S6--L-glutamate ligase|nr:RimK family alpha-L-glutamate ligase [Planctomycetota bacterium]
MDVLILSRNVAIYSTRRLTEAFRARGFAVRALDPAAIGVRLGPEGPSLATAGLSLPLPAVAVPRIGVQVTEHALAVLAQLELLGVPLTAGSRAVHASRDKMLALQTLAAAGLPVPPTALARQSPDADWAVSAVGGPPVVLKFLTGTHGVGVFLAESVDAARTVLDAMWGIERNLLVQKFVKSAAGRDVRLFVVGGEVRAAMRRFAPPGAFRAGLHSGGRAEALVPEPALADLAVRAAAALDLSIAGVDLLESEDGPLVNEVNSSPGLEGIEDATGVDLAATIADHALALAARRSTAGPSGERGR